MIAYSKSQKQQAKRGRPKKEGALRTSSGQISRAKEPPARVAQLARMKIFGMTASEALSRDASDNLGRLHLAWKRRSINGISVKQYDAAERYREVWNEYRKTLCAPAAYYEQTGLIGASNPDGYEAWVKRATQAYDDACKIITDAQVEIGNGNLWAAVRFMLNDDEYFPHMLGDIRLVCNALHRHFFTRKRKKSR